MNVYTPSIASLFLTMKLMSVTLVPFTEIPPPWTILRASLFDGRSPIATSRSTIFNSSLTSLTSSSLNASSISFLESLVTSPLNTASVILLASARPSSPWTILVTSSASLFWANLNSLLSFHSASIASISSFERNVYCLSLWITSSSETWSQNW